MAKYQNICHFCVVLAGRCLPVSLTNGRVTTYSRPIADGLYPFTTIAWITCNSGYYDTGWTQCFYPQYWSHPPRCDRSNEIN